MKKILLISDTHGYLDQALPKYMDACDEIWHAGDIGDMKFCDALPKNKTFRAVYGNIDGNDVRSRFPEDLVFECEKVKVLITHIAGYPGKFNPRAKKLIQSQKPGLFICGHSHILRVMYDKSNEMLFMNPGACGMSGFHQVKTALRFEIEGEEIKNLDVIELGRRNVAANEKKEKI